MEFREDYGTHECSMEFVLISEIAYADHFMFWDEWSKRVWFRFII